MSVEIDLERGLNVNFTGHGISSFMFNSTNDVPFNTLTNTMDN